MTGAGAGGGEWMTGAGAGGGEWMTGAGAGGGEWMTGAGMDGICRGYLTFGDPRSGIEGVTIATFGSVNLGASSCNPGDEGDECDAGIAAVIISRTLIIFVFSIDVLVATTAGPASAIGVTLSRGLNLDTY
jgi:hypothetical protein